MYKYKAVFIICFILLITMPGPVIADVPPPGWTVIDNEGNGVIWTTVAGSGESANYTGGTGDCASVSSDAAGTVDFDTELRTPVMDLSASPDVHLDFLANYQNFANEDFFDVDISTNGGGTWTNVLRWNEDHGTFRGTPGEAVSLDISPQVGSSANVMIRFHYYDPAINDWEWYVQVDDVRLHDGSGNTIWAESFDPPSFSKIFTADTIISGNTSTLSFTIDNSANGSDYTGLDFTDNLPAGLIVATPANDFTTCTGGTLTAVSGSGVITYTGGTVSAGSTCTISVDVTSTTPGTYNNVTGDLTSSAGNSGNASATLTVTEPPQPIPTLDEWGMILMLLILSLLGFWGIHRRQQA